MPRVGGRVMEAILRAPERVQVGTSLKSWATIQQTLETRDSCGLKLEMHQKDAIRGRS